MFRAILRFLISRTLWTFIALLILSLAIWFYGGLLAFGEAQPLAGPVSRVILIGVIWLIWLLRILFRQMAAARANRVFVSELAQPEEDPDQGAENVAEVNQKFQDILAQMKRSKLGGRQFLREMPWYVIIGPPGTGKTTALQQSGLHFPIDLSDDLKGMGGTRNCDWFFTEDAVLIDTAGRYVQQKSDPETDAAEWRGFLDLLRKHRGRRSLNGVILTLSVEELLGDEAALKDHGREIRRRLSELTDRLQIQLPVYLMITKADLLPGFETFFGELGTRAREQVWGATLGTEARVDGATIDREMRALQARLEERLPERIGDDLSVSDRGSVFRFPAEVDRLTGPLKALIDTVFGESRYEETPWLRGFYLTSATQEGTPMDRMIGSMAASFGLSAPMSMPRRHSEARSFFLRNLLTDVIFNEAGLGTFDPRAEERRRWIWRGTLAGATLATTVAAVFFLFSYQRYSGAIDQQEEALLDLNGRIANAAARQPPTDPLTLGTDFDVALAAVNEAQNAAVAPRTGFMTSLGPTADLELEATHSQTYDHVLRNILEPRMVAILEATMQRHLRDPEFLLGALKSYQMMTGLAPFDTEFLTEWWTQTLPVAAPIDPFPTDQSIDQQIDAIARMAQDEELIEPDNRLVTAARQSICTVPLATRAYNALMSDPDVASIPDWIPAEHAGPNGTRIFTRLSEKTLRVGLPGAFTYSGFQNIVLPLVPEIAAQAANDASVFAGGCAESANTTVGLLEKDILKLYYDDFIASWDATLRDLRLVEIGDLALASANLKDLSSQDSALKRLLQSVANETYLTRPEPPEGSGASVDQKKAQKALLKAATKKMGKLGKVVKKGSKMINAGDAAGGTAPEEPGEKVSTHFAPLRGMVEEVEGQPARIAEVELVLTALSNEMQTVMATPNPQATLQARGGLPTLTGSVLNLANTLPSPANSWLAALAQEVDQTVNSATLDQLNARWQADVLPFCRSATAGRYPFDGSSQIDVNMQDFARLFGPGGLFDGFITNDLGQFIDTAQRPWQWRANYGVSNDALIPFERARRIRDALFTGGTGPSMSFILTPLDLSPSASRVTLNVDGQSLFYANGAPQPASMTWPAPGGSTLITLTFTPLAGGGDVITSESGSWALLRLFRKGRLRPTNVPEVFRLGLAAGGHSAQFELRALSVENPFSLEVFSGFSCPTGFP